MRVCGAGCRNPPLPRGRAGVVCRGSAARPCAPGCCRRGVVPAEPWVFWSVWYGGGAGLHTRRLLANAPRQLALPVKVRREMEEWTQYLYGVLRPTQRPCLLRGETPTALHDRCEWPAELHTHGLWLPPLRGRGNSRTPHPHRPSAAARRGGGRVGPRAPLYPALPSRRHFVGAAAPRSASIAAVGVANGPPHEYSTAQPRPTSTPLPPSTEMGHRPFVDINFGHL